MLHQRDVIGTLDKASTRTWDYWTSLVQAGGEVKFRVKRHTPFQKASL